MRALYRIYVVSLCITLSACAHITGSLPGELPKVTGEYYPRKVENLEEILKEIEARNETVETHPEWLFSATQGLMLRNLDDLSESDYPAYRKYLDDGIFYIIVHPAYSVFFNDGEPYRSDDNPVDAFLSERMFSKYRKFVQEQERSLRDFLEITSTRKRLVLLVLPGDYGDYSGFVYTGMADEYARYINSVTNGSESVLYLFSEKPFRGYLQDRSRQRLVRFIETVRPKNILLGGGYLGRCVEDFYRQLTASIGPEDVSVVAEITSIGSEDLKKISIEDFLKEDKLNIAMLKEVIQSVNMKGASLKNFLRNYRNYRVQGK